ncbi:Di-copper centre-containing protein [Sporormia fimetaria CBS 119925]|uniref:Di-copper centre-containing protein n=1 Tax=Sporormia fimetaria CBS 119925 TaxID=1340428 RepID=A0A6A6UZ41_9PLEO|nr:Di-copper centre-containing protein [Sporormia fimetaria CBS 119925]
MLIPILSSLLAISAIAAAVPQGNRPRLAPKLPLSDFNTTKFFQPITLEEALEGARNDKTAEPEPAEFSMGIMATCANPRVRTEWHSATTDMRRAYVNAIRCLLGRAPSGNFRGATNRYEDAVALHQSLTPNVHGNHKFLLWHRYYLWAFEDMLRGECGYTGSLLWFDESVYAGRFSQSSVFSNDYFGAVNLGGNCVTNGAFAGLTLNIGPGTSNRPHCLARNEDNTKTANTNAQIVDACNRRTSYADMASCSEGGAHAWGHNGIGAVMQDTYGSPGDPVFWLHHAWIDRNFRIWQNADQSRYTYIDGTDRAGNPLTLDMGISLNGLRRDVRIRDVINTLEETMCYKYSY